MRPRRNHSIAPGVSVASGSRDIFSHRSVGGDDAFLKEGRDGDEQAAYVVAAWLQRADRDGSLNGFFKPNLTPEERVVAAGRGVDTGGRVREA